MGLFIIIILIRIWFINYTQDQIIILRGAIDEVDEILSELPGDEGVRIIVLLPHERLAYGHPSPVNSLFTLKIPRFYGIYDTIIITIEMEATILLQNLCFYLLTIFLGGGGLLIFLNAVMELLHMRRLPISSIIIRRVTKVLLKMIPIIDGIPLVTPYRDLGLAVEDDPFL